MIITPLTESPINSVGSQYLEYSLSTDTVVRRMPTWLAARQTSKSFLHSFINAFMVEIDYLRDDIKHWQNWAGLKYADLGMITHTWAVRLPYLLTNSTHVSIEWQPDKEDDDTRYDVRITENYRDFVRSKDLCCIWDKTSYSLYIKNIDLVEEVIEVENDELGVDLTLELSEIPEEDTVVFASQNNWSSWQTLIPDSDEVVYHLITPGTGEVYLKYFKAKENSDDENYSAVADGCLYITINGVSSKHYNTDNYTESMLIQPLEIGMNELRVGSTNHFELGESVFISDGIRGYSTSIVESPDGIVTSSSGNGYIRVAKPSPHRFKTGSVVYKLGFWYQPFYNVFDAIGDTFSMERLDRETNLSFRDRINLFYKAPATITQKGIYNAVSRLADKATLHTWYYRRAPTSGTVGIEPYKDRVYMSDTNMFYVDDVIRISDETNSEIRMITEIQNNEYLVLDDELVNIYPFSEDNVAPMIETVVNLGEDISSWYVQDAVYRRPVYETDMMYFDELESDELGRFWFPSKKPVIDGTEIVFVQDVSSSGEVWNSPTQESTSKGIYAINSGDIATGQTIIEIAEGTWDEHAVVMFSIGDRIRIHHKDYIGSILTRDDYSTHVVTDVDTSAYTITITPGSREDFPSQLAVITPTLCFKEMSDNMVCVDLSLRPSGADPYSYLYPTEFVQGKYKYTQLELEDGYLRGTENLPRRYYYVTAARGCNVESFRREYADRYLCTPRGIPLERFYKLAEQTLAYRGISLDYGTYSSVIVLNDDNPRAPSVGGVPSVWI